MLNYIWDATGSASARMNAERAEQSEEQGVTAVQDKGASGLVAGLHGDQVPPRGASMSRKGPSFERQVASRLSLWWTGGKRDDVFYRSQSSGARATARAKRGQATKGQYGDLCASDPMGQPFIDLLTVEIKRGYNRSGVQDLLDGRTPHTSDLGGWLLKLQHDYERAGSWAWMLIARRDSRQAVVYIPRRVWFTLRPEPPMPLPRLFLDAEVGCETFNLVALQFEHFLTGVVPERLMEEHKRFLSSKRR